MKRRALLAGMAGMAVMGMDKAALTVACTAEGKADLPQDLCARFADLVAEAAQRAVMIVDKDADVTLVVSTASPFAFAARIATPGQAGQVQQMMRRGRALDAAAYDTFLRDLLRGRV